MFDPMIAPSVDASYLEESRNIDSGDDHEHLYQPASGIAYDEKTEKTSEEDDDGAFTQFANDLGHDEVIHAQPRSDFPELLSVIASTLQLRWITLEKFLLEPSSMATSDVHGHFEAFRDIETAVSQRARGELVRPSGCLNSRLQLKYHYPTPATLQPNDGETADTSAPCPSMLIRKGLTGENTFQCETYFRREKKLPHKQSPLDVCSEALRDVHEGFSQWCDENATGVKVVLIFGKANARVLRDSTSLLAEWTIPFDAGSVTIGWSGKKIFVFCHHPEWLFHTAGVEPCQLYDLTVNIAVALANVGQSASAAIVVDATYFERLSPYLKTNVNRQLNDFNASTNYEGHRLAADKKRPTSTNPALRSTRSSDPIEIVCYTCKLHKRMDPKPTFITEGRIDGCYIARTSYTCQTPSCAAKRTAAGKKGQTLFVPSDQNIPWVTLKSLCPSEKRRRKNDLAPRKDTTAKTNGKSTGKGQTGIAAFFKTAQSNE